MLMSYTSLSDAELERWIYSSPHDVRALDEALNRLSTGEEKYTQEELDDAVYEAEKDPRQDDAYNEGYADGKADR